MLEHKKEDRNKGKWVSLLEDPSGHTEHTVRFAFLGFRVWL